MAAPRTDYQSRIQGWERKTPWYRRISARTGLQGKLVLSFMFLLVVTLGAASMQFVSEGREMTEAVLGSKATTIANAVGIGAEEALTGGDRQTLSTIGRRVLDSGDVVGVAFFSPSGELLSSTWRDGDPRGSHARGLSNPRENPIETFRPRPREDADLGPHIQVTAPVRVDAKPAGAKGGRVVGFVTVCLSQVNNAWQVSQAQAMVVLIGAVAALVSLPLVYMLVHRIFHPIRALVDATNRIAAGDLDAEVAVHRPDVIGDLARSFNEMVRKVRVQQDELEAANTQLEFTNEQLAGANSQLERANGKLADANRDLEEKVRQRTAQVEAANRRLRNEIAEKEDFLRAVSHDLNAPLRNIAGMATMLLLKHKESFNEDVIHRLERIQKNVQVETDLIAELLELSRIKTRRQKLEPVDLNKMVRELADVFEEDLGSREIALSVDTRLPVVECEGARMRQVFQNLIDNAIKYMGEGSSQGSGFGVQGSGEKGASASLLNPEPRTLNPPVKEIHVGCTVRADEAEFYVRDTGIGIEPEDIDKVFFVFRRGKAAAVQAVAGKGIGLASVKSIVETYEGTIWVESEVGKGTTFRFTINGKHVPDTKKVPVPPPVKGNRAA